MKRIIALLFIFQTSIFLIAQTPTLVINEVSNGAGGNEEYFEFLVIGPKPKPCEAPATLDLRDWIFDDNNGYFGGSGSGKGIAQGAFRFKSISFWSAVPVGTLIVIYNAADYNSSLIQDDLSLTDGNCKLVIPSNSNLLESHGTLPDFSNSTYSTSGWSSPPPSNAWNRVTLNNSNDGVLIFRPTNTTTPVHSFAYGNSLYQHADIGFSGGGGQSVYSMHNTNSDDFYNVSNWKKENAGTPETPGLPNSTENATYISSLNNNCSSVPVTVPAITVSTINTSCGNANGAISISVSGGTSPHSYAWSNGSSSQNLTNVPAGTYSVTVKDANGCEITDSGTINNGSSALTAPSIGTVTQTTCTSSTGSVVLSDLPAGNWTIHQTGTATDTYTGSGTSFTVSNLSAGTYTFTVTDDASTCTSPSSTSVTIDPQPSAPTAPTIGTVTQTTCTSATGSVVLNGLPSGNWTIHQTGTATNTYTGSGTSFTIPNLSAGTYTFTVTDDASTCTSPSSASVTINPQVGAPVLTITNTTNSDCNTPNGSISTSVSGGTAPYSYLWSDGSTSQDLTGLSAGTYTVTVTDANGCTATNGSGTVISSSNAPTVTVESVTNTFCGNTDGAINISVSGGTTPYSYAWSDGSTSQDLTGLSAGTYTVTVTDANGCTATNGSGTVINGSSTPMVTVGTTANASCGNADGTINISVSDGTAPYSYAWSDGSTSQNLTGLSAGTYTVTVTDANGCTATNGSGTVISSSNVPTVTVESVTNTSCGNADGAINISVSDGTAPYSYAWSDGSISQNLTGLSAGTYTITVTDANNCSSSDQITVTDVNTTVPQFTNLGSVCQGTTITLPLVSDNGITGSWSPAFDNTQTTTYTFTPDAGQCAKDTSIQIVINSIPNTPSVNSTAPTCTADGIARVTNYDAAVTYIFSPTGPSVGANGIITGFIFGQSYTLIADNNNCLSASSNTFTVVAQLPAPTITINADKTSICVGDSVILTANGASSYSWDTNLGNGNTKTVMPETTTTYTVVGVGANGCTGTASTTVNILSNTDLVISADTTSGCSPVSIQFTAQLAGANSFLWNFGDGTTSTAQNPTHTFTGDTCYTVTLTADNGQSCFANATLSEPICVFPVPNASFVPSTSEITNYNTTIRFTNNSTNATFYNWDFGDDTENNTDVNPIYTYNPDDIQNYTVMLVAENDYGCTDTATVTIKKNEDIVFHVPNAFTPDGDEFNNIFKPVIVAGYDYEMLIFNRWGELVFETRDSKVGWDGTYQGKICQDGTYVWRITIMKPNVDDKIIKAGHVTLLR